MEVMAIKDDEIRIVCPRCCRSTIAIILEVKYTTRAGRYISCCHCGFRFEDQYEGLKDCMSHSSYVRNNGAIKQKK